MFWVRNRKWNWILARLFLVQVRGHKCPLTSSSCDTLNYSWFYSTIVFGVYMGNPHWGLLQYIIYWSDSNLILMESKKFEFWDLNLAIRIYIKNKPGIENMRSHNFQKCLKFSIQIFNSTERLFLAKFSRNKQNWKNLYCTGRNTVYRTPMHTPTQMLEAEISMFGSTEFPRKKYDFGFL